MFEQKPPALSALSVLDCHFRSDQIGDFSCSPRPFYILSLMRRGQADFIGRSGTVRVAPGDVFLIPMGETYRSLWYGPGDLYCTSVFFTFWPSHNPLAGRQYALQKLPGTVHADWESLFDTVACRQPRDGFFSFEALIAFCQLCRAGFTHFAYQEKSADLSVVQGALDYLDQHPETPASVGELARLCHLSESRFYHVFKQAVGQSPVQYKNSRAIARAQLYLQSGDPYTIEQISEKCGFSSAIYFRRVFKQITGQSPGAFRKQPPL